MPADDMWQVFTPSTQQEGEARYAFRAALWVSRKHRAHAVSIPSHDIVAAAVSTRGGVLLVVAAYDVRSGRTEDFDDQQLRGKLRLIKEAWDSTKEAQQISSVGLLVCADFNRHHVLWGGILAAIEPGRSNEAEGIIDFMQENATSSLLLPATITCESYNDRSNSTVDLILASADIANAVTSCGIH